MTPISPERPQGASSQDARPTRRVAGPARTTTRLAAGAAALGLALSLTACGGSSSSGDGSAAPAEKLTLMIGSSGDAETKAVEDAVKAWGTANGSTVEVVAASDLTQQLGQGFSGDNPPDLFYTSWDQFQGYAKNKYLEPYAKDAANAGDFYPALRDAFTYDGEFYCEPKDFSTLALVINTDLWKAAGLSDADIPKDWAGLEAAATKLTKGDVTGLSFAPEYTRVGTFMNQAGGSLVSEDGKTVTANTAENLAGLQEVQKLLKSGSAKYPSALDAGWAGEAFGKGKAAMVIEGPWLYGALEKDFPDVASKAVELPAGTTKSSFTFSNCWGIPAGSETAETAEKLVQELTSEKQQLAFADAFGVLPSTQSGAKAYAAKYPEKAAFVAANDYAVSPVSFAGAASVITDFNSSLESLATGDPQKILDKLQSDLQQALDKANG